MTVKILITGAHGMLGADLVSELEKKFDVYGLVRQHDPRPRFYEGDITDRTKTITGIERVHPKIVIHAAAMTDVDGCESDRQLAMKINFEGTKNVVDGARHVRALFIYISTDFVFSGMQREPYREAKLPHPINVYGESKLLGEFYAREQSAQYLIVRTAWTFGVHGKNFMTKILDRAREAKELFVVDDQKGSPTYTRDLASAIRGMIEQIETVREKNFLNAVYHLTNRGIASRREVACELLRQAHMEHVKVTPIDSSELKNFAKRPQNSALDNSRFEKTFGFSFRPWQEAISDYLGERHMGERSHQN